MAQRRTLVWVLGVLVLLGAIVAAVMVREQGIVREARQAHASFNYELRKFEEAGRATAGFYRLPPAAQYEYLKTEVYPARQAHLDRARAKLATLKSLSERTWNRELGPGLKRYQGTAAELYNVYEQLWANEKAIDKEYYAQNWPRRNRLALARKSMLEKQKSLMQEAEKRWNALKLD